MEYTEAKTIVTKTKSSEWFGADYNMNIYRGCCHKCIYCDSRSDCYRIDDFDRVRAKKDALRIIAGDLKRKIKKGVVATGAMSDPYNPFEKDLLLTRHAMELVSAYGFGAAVATKGALITRDADIYKEINSHSPVILKLTVTAAEDWLSQKIEPAAPPSSERFKALEQLASEGIFCGVLLMPVLPFITDSEQNIAGIVERAAECGAKFIYPYFGVTLRANQREYFFSHIPDNIREKYIKRFGNGYNCLSPNSKKLFYLFKNECAKRGILSDMKAITAAYKNGYQKDQLSFFDM